MHRWGASVFIILMFMHMGRVVLFGAYKFPREMTWLIGVLLLALGLLEGFTGYLLPWDQTAYWATTVGININGTGPIIGPFLAQFLQGGTYINGDTLLALLLAAHAVASRRDHRADRAAPLSRRPPRRDVAAVVEGSGRHGPLTDRRRPGRRSGRRALMASRYASRSNRKVFKQYKEDVKTRGKPFFPHAMLHDTIMSIVVVAVIIGLTVIWKYSTPGDHTGFGEEGTSEGQAGWLGKLLDDPADPGTISFVPRPDWYFYFLFYLLRIFKWPESVILGTIGIPTIALILLLALPFIDRRPERRPSRRPVIVIASILAIVTMAVLTYKGATAKEALGSEVLKDVPRWAEEQGFADNAKAVAGAELFAQIGCLQLPHVHGRRLEQPRRARSHRGRREGPRHRLADRAPQEPGERRRRAARCRRSPRSRRENLTALAAFLEASKGVK